MSTLFKYIRNFALYEKTQALLFSSSLMLCSCLETSVTASGAAEERQAIEADFLNISQKKKEKKNMPECFEINPHFDIATAAFVIDFSVNCFIGF